MDPRRPHRLPLERRLGDWARQRVPPGLHEFLMFGLKQGWAALFGGLMLGAILASTWIWQPGWAVSRYDALLVFALGVQAVFLALGLESWREARVIALFHLTGTAMEIFKVHMGSWVYPEPALAKLWGVPLFSGFMYAAVGSYMARVIRIFEMRFEQAPPFWGIVALAVMIYANFFWHHFGTDIRLGLFAGTVVLFWRCQVRFTTDRIARRMPLVVAALLTACFLYLAEVIGTLTRTWIYAGGARIVPPAKFGSWYLLLYVSFATVLIVYRDALYPGRAADTDEAGTATQEGQS